MIFSSIQCIFYFLPIAIIGYYILGFYNTFAARLWLLSTSLVFYGFWDPRYVFLLLLSMLFNYGIGIWIRRSDSVVALWIGLSGNLLALFYFKYVYNMAQFLGGLHLTSLTIDPIVLPLGISFFTFTQIGYLIDSHAGMVRETNLLDYANFVTFFPHLIIGPILHHREIMPQLEAASTYRLRPENLSIGLTAFVAGLSKKVLIADNLAPAAEHGFANVHALGAGDAWIAALSYSLQLYFDFSGYSDMAIGIAKMFGVSFPLNFNSPHKAVDIIDFWQRWHMTLTRYITLYIFNPMVLALTRRRVAKRLPVGNAALATPAGFIQLIAAPLFVTMGLAGIWHGAGLQYVVFGLLHGTYLTINHAWRAFASKAVVRRSRLGRAFALARNVLLTYLAVLIGQVFFRADSVGDAIDVLGAMLGWREGSPDAAPWRVWLSANETKLALIAVCLLVVWFTPNVYNMLGKHSPALNKVPETRWSWLEWRPAAAWAFGVAALFFVSVVFLQSASKFLYFQF